MHPYQQHMADLASSSMAHNSAHAIISTHQHHTMDMHLRNGEVSFFFIFWNLINTSNYTNNRTVIILKSLLFYYLLNLIVKYLRPGI